MNNYTLYLTGPADKIGTRREWLGDRVDILLLVMSVVLLLGGVVGIIGALTGVPTDDSLGRGILAFCSTPWVAAGAYGTVIQVDRNVLTEAVTNSKHGTDDQVRGLYRRIDAVTEHSTAGWDDDLWQSLFTIGQLCKQKHQVQSVELGQELYDEIRDLVGELNEMITARQNLVDRRRELGMSTTVPGNADQRAVTAASEELEALSFRPLLRDRIEQAKNHKDGEAS